MNCIVDLNDKATGNVSIKLEHKTDGFAHNVGGSPARFALVVLRKVERNEIKCTNKLTIAVARSLTSL